LVLSRDEASEKVIRIKVCGELSWLAACSV
jgi:hypothetical protein